MGVSMGGYGAMMVAAHHPDLFAAASSLSGAVDSHLPARSPPAGLTRLTAGVLAAGWPGWG